MAYLSFSAKGQQLGRRAVHACTLIGRAPDCDISVRDILLSRHHCKIQLDGTQWILIDLSSKNGTFVDGQPVTRHELHDGDSFTIGQTVVGFRGAQLGYQPADEGKPVGSSRRPADPWEALAGTVCGFDFNASAGRIDVQRLGCASSRPLSQFPKPQPNPRDPRGYGDDDVYSMLTEIASSSWDSIYSEASKRSPVRPMPRPMVRSSRHARSPMPVQQDLLMAATEEILQETDRVTDRAARRQRWGKTFVKMLKGFAGVGQWLLLLGSLAAQGSLHAHLLMPLAR
jgi:predicted component of type VI protein secretion system